MAEVSYEIPRNLPDAVILFQASERLAAIEEPEVRTEALQAMFKLIDNVLASPEDVKKRRLKKTNESFHRKVGQHEAAMDFLRGVGFFDDDDPDAPDESGKGAMLYMPVAYLTRLTDAHHTLAKAAHQVGFAPPSLPGSSGFNPYLSNRQSTDTTRTAKAPDAWKNEADRVRDEVKKREREIKEQVDSAPAVDLQPTAFWLSSGRRLEDVVRETAEQGIEERHTDNALLHSQLETTKAAIAGNGKFESADKRRLADLAQKRVHTFCILRIICPDKSVLQVQFRAADTGERVLQQLGPLLAPHVRDVGWYVYQSPPLKRLAPRETLAAAGLTPGANLYLGFEGSKPAPPYLEAGLAAKLGPPPQDSGRGVTGPSFSGEAMGWGAGQRLGGAPQAPTQSGPGGSIGGQPAAGGFNQS